MSEFIFRTEDIRTEQILGLYVETAKDKRIVDLLKSANPVILEGSRGTGKSFLLGVAEAQLLASFQTDRVLPVYLSFVKSSLLQSNERVASRLFGRERAALPMQPLSAHL